MKKIQVGEIKMKYSIEKNLSMSLRASAKQSKSFALLYAILIMFLFMITASAVAFSALADIRQYKQAKGSLGALSAAQSGIEAGLATKSTDTCRSTVKVNINGGEDDSMGYYIKEVCLSGEGSPYIQSTGVFSGTKIKLRADGIDNPVIYQTGI